MSTKYSQTSVVIYIVEELISNVSQSVLKNIVFSCILERLIENCKV